MALGNRFGFDILDVTGLTAGTVYPALERLEELGYLTSRWEDARVARKEKRPSRRYFDLTAKGSEALAVALEKHKSLERVPSRRTAPGRTEPAKAGA